MSSPAYAERAPPGADAAGGPAADGAALPATGAMRDPTAHVPAHPLARVLNALNELAAIRDVENLLKSAVVVARDCIGFERAVLFSRDATPRVVRLRGSWGIDADGQVTEARSLLHECTGAEQGALLQLHQDGRLWRHYGAPALDGAPCLPPRGIDWSWVVATPLIAGGRLIGILYNGGGAHTPLDEAKQLEAAILCGCIGVQLLPLRHRLALRASEPVEPRSMLVERVRATVHETPALRGAAIAEQLGLSSGHLARKFKHEVGVSLVEYRQRLLLERFFVVLGRGQVTLLDAATEAGFGSYAQFHRVYRKLMGAAPYESLTRRPAPGQPAPEAPGPSAPLTSNDDALRLRAVPRWPGAGNA
ncbi:MAG TPA: AraC family transcriptional regulator [Polyangiaceae bacterium]|nr:AraC family transcriptional regulator [Polyangiaceae bacterium]